MKPSEMISLFHDIRSELELSRGITPQIKRMHESRDDELIVVVSDRAEKSLFLGPGGRVITEIVRTLGRNVSIFSEDEILIRTNRLGLTKQRVKYLLGRVKGKQRSFLQDFLEAFGHERDLIYGKLSYTARGRQQKIPVAFSGGVDSGSSLLILKRYGFNVHAITVDLGLKMYTPDEMETIMQWVRGLGVEHIILPGSESVEDVSKKASLGLIHPCGDCHHVTMRIIKEYVKHQNFQVLITGEMLPTGRQSICIEEGLLIIHLPASLALNKHDTRTTCANKELNPEKHFGCRLVSQVHSQGWGSVRPSIHRVLRELGAGILSTGQAMILIKDILRPALTSRE